MIGSKAFGEVDFKLFSKYVNIVETTGFHGAGHAIETMDSISQALSLPVKTYLNKIDKLGNY